MAEDMQQNEYRRGQGRQLRNKSGGNVEIQENTNVVQANRSVAMNAASVLTMGKSTGAQLLEVLAASGAAIGQAAVLSKQTTGTQDAALEGAAGRLGYDHQAEISHMIKTGEINQDNDGLAADQAGPPEPGTQSMSDEINMQIEVALEKGDNRADGVMTWVVGRMKEETAGMTEEVQAAYANEFYEPTVKAILGWDASNLKVRRDDMASDLAWKMATGVTYDPPSRSDLKDHGFTADETNSLFMDAASAALQANDFGRAREIMKREFRGKNDAAARAKLETDIDAAEKKVAQEKVETGLGAATYEMLMEGEMNSKTVLDALGDQTDSAGLQNFRASIDGYLDNGAELGSTRESIISPLEAMLDLRNADGSATVIPGSQAWSIIQSAIADVPGATDGYDEDAMKREKDLTRSMIAEFLFEQKLNGEEATESEFFEALLSASTFQGHRTRQDYEAAKKQFAGDTGVVDKTKQFKTEFDLTKRMDNAIDQKQLDDIQLAIEESIPLLGAKALPLYKRVEELRNAGVIRERNSPLFADMELAMRREFLRGTELGDNLEFVVALADDEFLDAIASLNLQEGADVAYFKMKNNLRRDWNKYVNGEMGKYNEPEYADRRLDESDRLIGLYEVTARELGNSFKNKKQQNAEGATQ